MKVLTRLLVPAVALVALGTLPAAAQAVPGHVVVARTTDQALIIWDASPVFASFVSNKTAAADANTQLAHTCVRVAAQKLSQIAKNASSLTVRVIYNKTGAVSPVYGSPTFTGVERYATLELPVKDAFANRDHWQSLGAKNPLPKWMKFSVTGHMPPTS